MTITDSVSYRLVDDAIYIDPQAIGQPFSGFTLATEAIKCQRTTQKRPSSKITPTLLN